MRRAGQQITTGPTYPRSPTLWNVETRPRAGSTLGSTKSRLLSTTRRSPLVRSAEPHASRQVDDPSSQNVMDAPEEVDAGACVGDLSKACAHWVCSDVIVWRTPPSGDSGAPRSFFLNASSSAGIRIGERRSLAVDWSCELSVLQQADQFKYLAKFPHLVGSTLLKVPPSALEHVHRLVKYQLVVSCQEDGLAINATGVQIAGVLDDLYFYEGPLGAHSDSKGDLKVSVWAPTAFQVELLHWAGPVKGEVTVVPMEESKQGVWSLECPDDWMWQFYKFRVTAFSPITQRVEVMEVTDPYSKGLAANGERSQFVDMQSPQVKPDNWDGHDIPTVEHFSDISVYELHIRDFSATDATVSPDVQGKYVAFCPNHEKLSDGLKHLLKLKEAGLTHVHLLPSYDFASVPERAFEQEVPEGDLSEFPPDSEEQQRRVLEVANRDAFNWGYDPVHYSAPDGSYSTDPDGSLRIKEFRQMVKGLHELGLKVVLDVVYNHTYECGPHSKFSVFDKVVPGYYHRREENGDLCSSACGANTASEHSMFERFVVEDLVHWAKEYKVDGFRFDIMGHLMLNTMSKAQEALSELTIEQHGVDGKSIYLYGEGWDFGEVQNNRRGRNAAQLNIGGKGWGTFNDRFRDGVLGGSPLDSPTRQGLLTGLFLDPNGKDTDEGTIQDQRASLLHISDNVRLGLAGNLSHYQMMSTSGEIRKGKDFAYHTQPTSYCGNPWENIPFVGCHDNATQFDLINMKASSNADVTDRVKMSQMAISMVMLSQGIPFLHAGDELLRSKSFDHDSYNSGDWFNRIDWTYQSNNFGVGLPPSTKNGHRWPLIRPLLANRSLFPSPSLIQTSLDHTLNFLQIRYSSCLFRLRTAEDVSKQVVFHNVGPDQIPGVIVMEIVGSDDTENGCFDEQFEKVVVVFNSSPKSEKVVFDGKGLEVHPVLLASGDSRYTDECVCNGQELVLPSRTTCVWVKHS